MHRGSQREKRESSRARVESHRDAPAKLEMTSNPQLREQSRQGEEVEILSLKRSKLQKRRLPRRPPAHRRPCRASSLRLLRHMESARQCKRGKEHERQREINLCHHSSTRGCRQHGEASVRTRMGWGKALPASLGMPWRRSPSPTQSPTPSERDVAKPTGPLERAEHPISRPCWVLCSGSTSKCCFLKCPGNSSWALPALPFFFLILHF